MTRITEMCAEVRTSTCGNFQWLILTESGRKFSNCGFRLMRKCTVFLRGEENQPASAGYSITTRVTSRPGEYPYVTRERPFEKWRRSHCCFPMTPGRIGGGGGGGGDDAYQSF